MSLFSKETFFLLLTKLLEKVPVLREDALKMEGNILEIACDVLFYTLQSNIKRCALLRTESKRRLYQMSRQNFL
jgi:hypothetical protein